jgi:cytochrome c oxidase cbb3-type subunit 4
MSYQDVAGYSQIIAMVIFGAVMAGVLVYALRPGNRARFDAAARVPLALDDDEPGGRAKGLSILRDEDEEGQPNGRT